MAFQLDSNIPLMAQVPDMGQVIDRGMRVVTMADQLQQRREEAPLRKRMLEQQAQLQNQAVKQQTIQAQNAERDQGLANTAMWMSELPKMFKSGDYKGVMEAVNRSREDELAADQNADVSDHDEIISAIMSGDAADVMRAQNGVDSVLEMAKSRGVFGAQRSASQREFDSKTANLTEDEKEEAKRISLGLKPRAVGSAAQTIADEGTTGEVAKSEAEIAALKAAEVESAKLSAQLKLKPEVEAAVVTAVAEANRAGDLIGENRSNQAAFDLYETATKGLVAALGGTTTGPGMSWIPAITSNAQIANGAIAAMAPVLKQLFRAAGEGVFTDKDQELLLGMIPDRSTTAEARVSLLSNIDAIVRSKLKISEQPQGSAIDSPDLDGVSQEAANLLDF